MHLPISTVILLLSLSNEIVLGLQPQIPSIAFFTPSLRGPFELTPGVRIIVGCEHGNEGSPSVYDYAMTFRQDLISVTSYISVAEVELAHYGAGTDGSPVIFIDIDPSLKFTHFNGKSTAEGYTFEIAEYTYTIKAAGAIGTWWATRTILQQIALAEGNKGSFSIPAGSGTDMPGWEIRGFMLDAGRHWYEPSFLADLCTYASFFKLNEIHLHASDNLWNPAFLYGEGNEGWRHLYAAFRFQPETGSELLGLVPRRNESWTRDDWLALQASCASHGVTLVPEIDTPGHSLVISQWKPELMQSGQPDHLNLSHPDTIPTIKSIWDEFLPWFDAAEVSIGADEYDASLANDYISFVNEMSDYIQQRSNKSIRIWGTNEPSTTMSVSKDITIQHWDFPSDDIPINLMNEGYYVINSEQTFLYLDGKTSEDGQFPQELNQDLIWAGAPGGKGWAPNIFTTDDPSNNTNIENRHLRGALFAAWNDWGNNATTALEYYYQLSRSIAVFAEKTWAGSDIRDSALTRTEFDRIYPVLNAAAPGQNLNRVVKPMSDGIIYQYSLVHSSQTTSIDSVGPPYTLTFGVKPDKNFPDEGFLFAGADSKLHVANLTFEATGQLYALGYILPADQYTVVEIHATREYTYAVINGEQIYWFTYMDIWGDYIAQGNMSFAAPARHIGGGGFKGIIKDVVLRLGADLE